MNTKEKNSFLPFASVTVNAGAAIKFFFFIYIETPDVILRSRSYKRTWNQRSCNIERGSSTCGSPVPRAELNNIILSKKKKIIIMCRRRRRDESGHSEQQNKTTKRRIPHASSLSRNFIPLTVRDWLRCAADEIMRYGGGGENWWQYYIANRNENDFKNRKTLWISALPHQNDAGDLCYGIQKRKKIISSETNSEYRESSRFPDIFVEISGTFFQSSQAISFCGAYSLRFRHKPPCATIEIMSNTILKWIEFAIISSLLNWPRRVDFLQICTCEQIASSPSSPSHHWTHSDRCFSSSFPRFH